MSFLGAFPGASEPRTSFSSKSSQSSSSITGKHSVAFRASSDTIFFLYGIQLGVMFYPTLHLSRSVLNCVGCPVTDYRRAVFFWDLPIYWLDLFVHRNSTHRKRAKYKSGLELSQSPDKSDRLLFGLQVDTKRRKVLYTDDGRETNSWSCMGT